MPNNFMVDCPICCSPTDAKEFVSCHDPTNARSVTSSPNVEYKRPEHRACFASIRRYAETTLDNRTRLHDHQDILHCMHPYCENPLPHEVLRSALPHDVVTELKNRAMRDQDVLRHLALKRVTESNRHLTVAEKLSNIVIRRCPRCSTPLTKSIGCALVYCACGAAVCFRCGQHRSLFERYLYHVCPNSSLRSDKAKIKELFETSTAQEQRFIRALYPDVEEFKSIRHWLWDKAYENAVWLFEPAHFLAIAIVIVVSSTKYDVFGVLFYVLAFVLLGNFLA